MTDQRKKYSPPTIERVPVQGWSALTPKSMKGRELEGIGGISYKSLAEKYDTPLFIIDEETLRTSHRKMKQAFSALYPDVTLAWSYKTNYLSTVCTIFRTEGSWAEVVSGFEYEIARDLGVPGSEIIFNGPLKTEAELRRAFKEGAKVHADSMEEIEQMKAMAAEFGKPLEIGIRVNIQLNYPPWSKFGFSYEEGQAEAAVEFAQREGLLKVVGLHLHAGTYITDTSVYRTAASKLMKLAIDLEANGNFELHYIDLGGGYASTNTLHAQFLRGEAVCPGVDQYAEAICEPIIKAAPHLKRKPHLFIEPGRSVVDEGVVMITRVVSSKHLPDGSRAIIVDAGVHVLPTAYWYKHEMIPLTPGQAPDEVINVLGGLCMNIDVLAIGARMPAVQRGDLILVKSAGAYNFSQSMQFIYLRPNYVLIRDGQDFCIREKETHEFARAPEKLPPHLITQETRKSILAKKSAGGK